MLTPQTSFSFTLMPTSLEIFTFHGSYHFDPKEPLKQSRFLGEIEAYGRERTRQ